MTNTPTKVERVDIQRTNDFVDELAELISEYPGGRLALSVEVTVRLKSYLTTLIEAGENEKRELVEKINHLSSFVQHDISCITQFEEDEKCDCGLIKDHSISLDEESNK